MTLAADKASAYLQHNALPDITLIYGAEPLLNQEALDAARANAKSAGFNERQRLDMQRDAQWKTLLTEINTPSLFAPKRVIELNVDNKKLGKTPASVLQDLSAQTPLSGVRLIIHAPNLEFPQKTAWFKALIKAKTLEIRSYPLTQKDFEQQINLRLNKYKLRLNDNAYEQLLRYVEGNLLAAEQALMRLSYRPNHDAILSGTDLRETLSDLSRFGALDFRRQLFAGNWQAAYRIAGKLAAEDANQISLMTWQMDRDFSVLLQMRTEPPAKWESIFSDYRIYSRQQPEYRNALTHFSPGLLITLLKLTAKLDAIRKGAEAGDAWLTLQQFLLLRAQLAAQKRATA